MEESSPGPFGEQESLNVEQSDSMAHEERGSAEVIMELEPPLQQSSSPIGHDAEVNAESLPHMGPDVRRSGRVRRAPVKFKDYEVEGLVNPSKEPSTISQEVQAAVAKVMSHEHDSCITFESLFTLPQEEQTDQHPLIGMKSIMDPDTLYLWEARKEKDFPKFLEAMQKEIDDHTKEGHWKLVRRSKLPKAPRCCQLCGV